ncbi:unnamed protein product [Thlaspi arvense]|uniref:Uncharacterized protein n=1 Tax=Thlaspi arvense TaxID=13288 RepID=A0AAU9RL92_THLAR|nr:unnamed protein product [Thlaspi arvense]
MRAEEEVENQLNSSVNLNTDLIEIQKQEELVQRKFLEVFWISMCFHGNQEQRRKTTKKSEVSDSSSDLFEIENLTGKLKPCLTRQGSDAASPTRYAPSEVSIEWSIVTASAADFSVMSECATSPVYKQRLKHTNSSTNVTSQ